ncbi:MAG: ATP-dependent DNA helicase UvrD2 [Brooklawnia sp.]|uniref:ATP-dependent DNA helicase UvrD2 n=1 Tax=Brooklawnia sp. TaxID=2699740 RepID=UPI003C76DE45
MKVDPARAAEVLQGLDPQQEAVATSFGAPVAVLAGAGTGKTRAITHRIAYGALSGRLDPGHTLAVTFTTKAAGELRHRLAQLGVPRVQARTFHSAALRQIRFFWPRVHGVELPPVAGRNFSLIAEAARGFGVPVDTSLLRDLAQEISWAKVSNIATDRYADLAVRAGRQVSGLNPDQVGTAWLRYEQVKKRRQVIDFDDIMLCAIALLHEHPEVAAQVRDQYRHFTVDEYQDVSPVQRTLLELWIGDGTDVCVVGDVNQAIHTFAGAQPNYLINFGRDHPGAITLKLETNYRSTPQVLKAANALIGRGMRLRATRPDGPSVEAIRAADEQAEAAEVAAWLAGEHADGRAWRELGVLYRINAQAEAIQTELDALGVPYVVRDPEGTGEPASRPANPEQPDAVTLSTMHSAKGLEWESVAVIGLSEGLMPFGLADTPATIAEEQRLLYVAFTRARTRLRLSWAAGGASGRGHREPSRYLRRAGLVGDRSDQARAGRPTGTRQRSRQLPNCHVCGRPLSEATEIKLGRHEGCPVDWDEELFERLRRWRWSTAQTQSLPAFVVLTDATLRAITEQRPTDRASLLKNPGIGLAKADRYGEQIVEVVAAHGQQ